MPGETRSRAYRRTTGSATLLATLVATSLAAQSQAKPIDPANLDTTCAPCKNFFQYANGGWLKRNSIPGDQPRWGSFNELQEQNYAALQDVLTDAARDASSTKDPNLRKLGTFYGTCMDSAAVEAAGIKPLRPELAQLNAIHDRRGVQEGVARLQGIGIPAGFLFRSVPDAKKSARTIAEVYQGGLGTSGERTGADLVANGVAFHPRPTGNAHLHDPEAALSARLGGAPPGHAPPAGTAPGDARPL